jgi:hypothetical protein
MNSGHPSITTLAFSQDLELDQLSNWSGFDEDTDGNGSNNLVQDRTHNDANEITAISAMLDENSRRIPTAKKNAEHPVRLDQSSGTVNACTTELA